MLGVRLVVSVMTAPFQLTYWLADSPPPREPHVRHHSVTAHGVLHTVCGLWEPNPRATECSSPRMTLQIRGDVLPSLRIREVTSRGDVQDDVRPDYERTGAWLPWHRTREVRCSLNTGAPCRGRRPQASGQRSRSTARVQPTAIESWGLRHPPLPIVPGPSGSQHDHRRKRPERQACRS
jgi:hypothetical protein